MIYHIGYKIKDCRECGSSNIDLIKKKAYERIYIYHIECLDCGNNSIHADRLYSVVNDWNGEMEKKK